MLTFLKTVEGDFYPPLSERKSLSEYLDAELTDNSVTLLALHNQDIVGYVNCQFNKPQKNESYINTLAVSVRFRGRGIGGKLLQKILETAKLSGFKTIKTRTWSTNKSGLTLYKNCGFEVDYVVKNDRKNGVDSIYLIKEMD